MSPVVAHGYAQALYPLPRALHHNNEVDSVVTILVVIEQVLLLLWEISLRLSTSTEDHHQDHPWEAHLLQTSIGGHRQVNLWEMHLQINTLLLYLLEDRPLDMVTAKIDNSDQYLDISFVDPSFQIVLLHLEMIHGSTSHVLSVRSLSYS